MIERFFAGGSGRRCPGAERHKETGFASLNDPKLDRTPGVEVEVPIIRTSTSTSNNVELQLQLPLELTLAEAEVEVEVEVKIQ